MRVSPSSTPPTSTAPPGRHPRPLGASEAMLGDVLHGRRDRVVLATKFGGDMGDEGPPPAARPATSARRWTARSRACAPTMSTCCITTGPTTSRRSARRSPRWPSSSPSRQGARARRVQPHAAAARRGGRGRRRSRRSRTSTRCSTAAPERELLPRCRELGIGFVPYYPLAAGLLTGKYRHGRPPAAGLAPGRPRRSQDRRHVGQPGGRGLGGGVRCSSTAWPPIAARAPSQPARAGHRRASRRSRAWRR